MVVILIRLVLLDGKEFIMKICRKNNTHFGCKRPLQIEPKSIHQISKKERALIGQGEAYIRSYFKKEESIPAFEIMNKNHRKVEIHPHFLFKFITRLRQNKILKMRSIITALEEGTIFEQEGLNGFIIKGINDLVIIVKKLGNEKTFLSSIYPSEKNFTTWKEIATYAKTAKNNFVE